MKVHSYRIGTRRVRREPRRGDRQAGRIRRLWAPYKHRELVLNLIGLTLIVICVAPLPIGYWLRFRAAQRFEVEFTNGQPALIETEYITDHGRRILGLNEPFKYDDPFPTSGPYDRDWVEAGFYDSPRASRLLVHSLKRGLVVIYYDTPPPTALQTLREWTVLFHGDKDGIVVVAYPGLADHVVLTAWNRRLTLTDFDPNAAAAFVDAFHGRSAEKPE